MSFINRDRTSSDVDSDTSASVASMLRLAMSFVLESSISDGMESITSTRSSDAFLPACVKGTVAHSCDAKKEGFLVHME
jgi:hypothetical protein